MKLNLDALEVRVLGALMEKELTTPESYPLSLNSLVSACNQKSNREPVMNLTERDVQGALEALGGRGLARLTTTGGRVPRYRQSVAEKLGLSAAARAVLTELMLRGPQTLGELRNRAERMAELPDLAAVESILHELQRFGPPLVLRLPREPGRKEQRYAHLLAGTPELPTQAELPELPELSEQQPGLETAAETREPGRRAAPDRLLRLENEVGAMRTELATLRREIEDLIEQLR